MDIFLWVSLLLLSALVVSLFFQMKTVGEMRALAETIWRIEHLSMHFSITN